jgi:ribosomal protein S27E
MEVSSVSQSPISCPKCHSSQVFQSRRGNAELGLLKALYTSARCHTCSHLFNVLGGKSTIAPPPRQSTQSRVA